MAAKPKKFRALEMAIGAKFLRDADIKKMGVSRPAVTDEQRAEALLQLFNFLMTWQDTSHIISAQQANKETLDAIFTTLEKFEATYWVQGSYVPAAALADSYTLSYLLEAQKRDMLNSLAINQVLGYFDGLTKRLLFPDEKDELFKKR